MANGKIRFGKQSGGELALVIPDGVANTEVSFPESGVLATKDYADLKQSKSELAYSVNTSSYIPNTLASGAIIERGSNANGEYVKFADGTLICTKTEITVNYIASKILSSGSLAYPHPFTGKPSHSYAISSASANSNIPYNASSGFVVTAGNTQGTEHYSFGVHDVWDGRTFSPGDYINFCSMLTIGRWK